jgi:hypothetical protein
MWCHQTKDEMGGASGTYGGQEKCRVLVGKSEGRRPPEELSIDGTITLKET